MKTITSGCIFVLRHHCKTKEQKYQVVNIVKNNIQVMSMMNKVNNSRFLEVLDVRDVTF